MLQKDYWQMSDDELEALTEKYRVVAYKASDNTEWAESRFSRQLAITSLLTRDNALRTRWTIWLSVIALLVSIAAVIISAVKK
jgi:hypothetical protein